MRGPYRVDSLGVTQHLAPVVLDVSIPQLFDGGLALLASHRAVRVPAFLGAARCRELVRRVMEARPSWTADFDGDQYSLGRAWYTHLETDREDEYLARAAESDALVQRVLPGMQDHLIQAISNFVGSPVVRRPGWCGPGVHIFLPGAWLSRRGGAIHIDAEGLSDEQNATQAPALSGILMLQPPQSGGHLRLWDVLSSEIPQGPHEDVAYGEGDLVLISSHRLHQIQPFSGNRARISMTVHAAVDVHAWEAWF
jgi:hypothetical protein